MKTLSRGAQFTVSENREFVYKQLHTVQESASVFSSWGFSFRGKNVRHLAVKSLEQARTSLQNIRILLDSYPELAASFANPHIKDNLDYSQDKVIVLGEALRNQSRKEAKILIDKFIDLWLWHLGYGFAELVFNPAVNYGVDKNYNIVLIDLGELTFNKDKTLNAVNKKQWQRAQNYWAPLYIPISCVIPLSLKLYYRKQMLQRITPEVVINKWKEAIK